MSTLFEFSARAPRPAARSRRRKVRYLAAAMSACTASSLLSARYIRLRTSVLPWLRPGRWWGAPHWVSAAFNHLSTILRVRGRISNPPPPYPHPPSPLPILTFSARFSRLQVRRCLSGVAAMTTTAATVSDVCALIHTLLLALLCPCARLLACSLTSYLAPPRSVDARGVRPRGWVERPWR